MKTIFRIEDKAGQGMYRSDKFGSSQHNPMYGDGYDDMKHPLPHNDSLLMSNMRIWHAAQGNTEQSQKSCPVVDAFNFGFASQEQLRNWIYKDEWLVKLDQKFFLTLYAVPDEFVVVGHTQACFIREQVVNKRRYNITDYFVIS